jgi:hypothetical protein
MKEIQIHTVEVNTGKEIKEKNNRNGLYEENNKF